MPPGLETEVQYLKGVGPKNAMLLQRLGLTTVNDLIWHLPRRYDDRREIPPIAYLKPGRHATARGKLVAVTTRSIGRGGRILVSGHVEDDSGVIALTWFNQPWVSRQLLNAKGSEVIAFGLVREGPRRELEMQGPEWEVVGDDLEEFARIVPVYPLSEGVPQWAVRKACRAAVEACADLVPEPLPGRLRETEKLMPIEQALRQIHRPDSDEERVRARKRLAFDEFLCLQLALEMRRREVQQETGIAFPLEQIGEIETHAGSLFSEPGRTQTGIDALWIESRLMFPFELTRAQSRVVQEIWDDMMRPSPMNRLVQGDVGSGKTAVAACAMLAAARCGFQACLMAPTEILAEQHFVNLKRVLDPLGIETVLLVGKLGVREKRKAINKAANGEAQVCVGTHAVIQEGVRFQRLGLCVIDEQHRFGVLQRLALRSKSFGNPDVLVMTATPIPRTLTMSVYGDMDLSVIDELPPGRKEIKTHWRKPRDRSKVYDGVKKLLDEGRQAYFVCPMVSENEKMLAQAAEDLHYRLSKDVFPDKRVGLLHGQMKPLDKESAMNSFRNGETDVLVATVVIEVGVDVPNASVMVVEDANRFGLAQLHQLRGRVGRGDHSSFCVLIAEATSLEVEERMAAMVETTDGFKIAELDLRQRGPGDIVGTRQHGMLDFRVADLVQDSELLERAKRCSAELLDSDPQLVLPEHEVLRRLVSARRKDEALVTVS